MNKSFKHKISWNEKAKINPLFAIMSDDIFANVNIKDISKDQLDVFYSKGKVLWDRYLAPYFLSKHKNVLEFGCGMGRLLLQPALKAQVAPELILVNLKLNLQINIFHIKKKSIFL